jgi:hypothetical protein
MTAKVFDRAAKSLRAIGELTPGGAAHDIVALGEHGTPVEK